MQQTLSYSSSPSPTPISTITQPIRPPSRGASTETASATAAPAIISVDYSYDRSMVMSPSAHSTGNYNGSRAPSESLYADKASFNQPYSSLFGDPVPPPQPEDYFGTAAFETIRAGSVDMPSSEEDTLLAAVALNTLISNDGHSRRRLFSDVPYTNISSSTCRSLLPIPRLQPPDIQILPNSSGGSSSEQLDSPNFMLLAPQDIVNKPNVYELEYEQATQDLGATYEQKQAGRQREERPMSESYSSTGMADWYRPSSQHFAEFSRIPKLRPSSKMVMSMKHDEMPLSPLATMLQDSNGSSSGGEEQLPIAVVEQQLPVRSPVPNPIPTPPMDMDIILSPKQYLQQQKRQILESYQPTMSPRSHRSPKMPRTARSPSHSVSQVPESGNEMSVTSPEEEVRLQGEMSPVVIKDSVSTGGDYRVGDTRLHKKSSFTILSVRSPKSSLSHSPSTTPVRQQRLRHASIQSTTTSSTAAQLPAQSLPLQHHRVRRKSLAGSRLPQLPPAAANQLATDDSPRPSVQFNMSGGGYSPSKLAMPTKGILQQRDSLTSSVDTYTPRAQRRASTFGQRIKSLETLPLITDPYRSAIPRFHRSAMELDKEPAVFPPGPLPRPLKPNPNPTRKQRGLLGVINRDAEPPPQPRSNWLSLDDLVLDTRLAKSGLESMRLEAGRRSSSTSPERRSSTQTASDRRSSNLSSITTSDFSFRRPSLSTLPATTQRRKSVYLPTKSPRRRQSIVAGRDAAALHQQPSKRAKIAKPSTLSPIIGTPNKDTPQSPLHGSAYEAAHRDTPSDLSVRRDSISRIPVRNRMDLSQNSSRSNSPLKDFNSLSLLSGRNSQESNNSRSPSQATIRSSMDVHGNQLNSRLTPTRFHTRSPNSRGPPSRPDSRMAVQDSMLPSRTNSRRNSLANSQINSRANSRADSHANSRIDSRANSRANSRADSRTNSRANSRANSRLSVRSSLRSTSISPVTMMRNSRIADATPSRRKSISNSPTRRGVRSIPVRKMSLSPGERLAKRSPQKRDTKEASSVGGERRNSRSRIPRSTSFGHVKSSSPNKKQAKPTEKSRSPRGGRRTPAGQAKVSPKEKPNSKAESAKKKSASIGKPETGAKRAAAKTPSRVPSKKQSPSQAKTPQLQQKKQEKDSGKEKPEGKSAGRADKAATKPNGSNGQAKSLIRQGSMLQNAKRTNNESNAATKANKPTKASPEKMEHTKDDASKTPSDSINPLAVQVGNAVLQAAEALPAVRNEVNATATGAAVKRQGSNMSTLVRMSSRLSLMSNKKRADSAQHRKVATVQEQPQETEVTKGHAGTTGQLTSSDGVAQAQATSSDGTANTSTGNETGQPKTIKETSSDPKSHENETGIVSESAATPSPSAATMLSKATPTLPASHDSTSRLGTADGSNALRNAGEMMQKSPVPPTQPIEAAISVVNAAETDKATAELGGGQSVKAKPELDSERANGQEQHAVDFEHATPTTGSRDDFLVDDKRLSPDGQGGSTAGSGGGITKTGSQEFLKDDAGKGGVCRCCSTLCMRFRRSHCMRCCGRRPDRLHGSVEEQPVLSSARSSATTTTTQLEVVDETKKNKKSRCWPTSNCCKSCQKKPKKNQELREKQSKVSTMGEEPMHQSVHHPAPKQQGKCGLCLTKIFCCRSVNKVDPRTGDETELRKCCFCIPCRRKRGADHSTADPKVAWRDRDPEVGITATDAAIVEGSSVAPPATSPRDDLSKMSCCRRFWLMLFCCRKKPRRGSDARRQSIKAPPTSEETRRKLHNDLVEYTSKMKGAIPVLPLYLAWFCAFCNVIFPGLGTLLSGLFCLCVGIPRFSQFDSARARIGSFIINIIVAVAQFFCVLFCFVGWGWSIWWGTIMLKCAKKLSKIKKVERLELEEEQRQAELAAAAGAARGETEPAKT